MLKFGDEKGQLKCSFCSKAQEQVKKLIAGPGVYICNECIELCNEIIEEELGDAREPKIGKEAIPSPKRLHSKIDEYIIGQEIAKKTISVAVARHFWRTSNAEKTDIEIKKSNILIIGPTGVGKTYLAQTLARIVDLPFSIASATVYTESGYVGEDVESMLCDLIGKADFDIEKAETGIIYIDEIDKLAKKEPMDQHITHDISGVGVQRALLTFLEGAVVSVPPHGGRKHPHQEFIQLDTQNVLFIAAGAFNGLESIIRRRIQKQRNLAEFNEDPFLDITYDDLVQFGFLPEFISQFSILVYMPPLSLEELKRILTEPKNAIVNEYVMYFQDQGGVNLEFTDDAITAIASKALEMGVGARGLRACIEKTLLDIMYQFPLREEIVKCKVTAKTILSNDSPEFYTGDEKPISMNTKE